MWTYVDTDYAPDVDYDDRDALTETLLLSVVTDVYITSPITEEPDSAIPLLTVS